MRIHTRLALMACAALALLAFVAGSASASTGLSISPAGGITLTNVGSWTFAGAGGTEIICTSVVLRGTIAASVAKTSADRLPEGKIGEITAGTATGCTERVFRTSVTTTILLEANRRFPLLYHAFLGTLPNITGVLIIALNAKFLFRIAIVGECLYEGSVGNLIVFPPEAAGNVNRFLEAEVTRLTNVNRSCPATGSLLGRGLITPGQRLILI